MEGDEAVTEVSAVSDPDPAAQLGIDPGPQPTLQTDQHPYAQQYFLPAPPPRARTPKRYLVGATAIFTVGVALAAASVATSQRSTAKPVPPSATELRDESARAVWRTAPVDTVLPPAIDRSGGERYLRLGVADPAGCDVLPEDFRTELAAAAPGTSCVKVLRATYTDATQTVLVTVGIVVIDGTPAARDKVWRQWTPDSDAKRPSLMPSVFAVPATAAAKFADAQRVVWGSQTSDDGSYLVYAVSGFLDGRAGSTPDQLRTATSKALAADSPPVQAAVDLPGAFLAGLKTPATPATPETPGAKP